MKKINFQAEQEILKLNFSHLEAKNGKKPPEDNKDNFWNSTASTLPRSKLLEAIPPKSDTAPHTALEGSLATKKIK